MPRRLRSHGCGVPEDAPRAPAQSRPDRSDGSADDGCQPQTAGACSPGPGAANAAANCHAALGFPPARADRTRRPAAQTQHDTLRSELHRADGGTGMDSILLNAVVTGARGSIHGFVCLVASKPTTVRARPTSRPPRHRSSSPPPAHPPQRPLADPRKPQSLQTGLTRPGSSLTAP